VSVWYVAYDRNPPTFDAAWYLEVACRLFHALADGQLSEAAMLYSGAFRFKAPLISVLPLPFFATAGPSLDAALSVQLLSIPLLSYYVYKLGAALFSRPAAAIAVVCTLTMPILFGLSRIFAVELPLAALVTAAAYTLHGSNDLKRPGSAAPLGVLLGLGLLLKVLFPFYLLGPIVDLLLRQQRTLRGKFLKTMEPPLKTIIVIGGAIALTWYGPNLLYVLGYLYKASFGDIAIHYTTSTLRYWRILAADGPSYYYTVTAACLAILLLGRGQGIRHNLSRAWHHSGIRLCLLWFTIPFFIASLGTNKDIRFMTPCLPALALLIGAGLDAAIKKNSRPWLLTLFFLFPLAQYSAQTFGFPARLYRRANYSGPPLNQGAWKPERAVTWVGLHVGDKPAVVVAGQEHPYFNANTLSYLAARNNVQLKFISYGYAYTRIADTVARLRDKNADFLLLADGLPVAERDPHAVALDPKLRALISAGQLPFRKIDTMTIERDQLPPLRLELYRRTSVIRMTGASGG
jgi:4-amino-4-deoxy-L-arabinose transferase-like glycosyltransferase